ncbi:MAG TPA: acyltransferase domain-containing protein [Thermoanaerobaculia bacterium]|nr:acyltransferase domain-containing protein [Thermoanaerobaculia bacterium]
MTETEIRTLLLTRLAVRLGVDPGSLDPQESFSSYGLDSAGAIGLISEMSDALGMDLSPTLIWAHPTPAEMARHLAVGDTAPAVSTSSRPTAPVDEPVAVVGLSCRFPGAPDVEAFWRMLSEGVDANREVPRERWDPTPFYDPDPEKPGTTNTRRGTFLDRIDEFDPLFFGISPREASEMDPQQRIMLELSWEALEDAGVPPRDLSGTKTGVFFGVVWRDYADVHRQAGARVTTHTGVGQGIAIIPNRVSYALGLRGPSLVVDTACSSSLLAIHLACQSLRAGECSVALAGGINLMLVGETMVALTKFGGLSGDGRCKAFDARADGFGRGEGAGIAVLKPLSRAVADGDRIYCVVRGSAVNNDGASNGLTAPNPQAQVEVLEEAYARAGVDPARVDYVEAHGTGTPLGDPIETRALAAVLGRDRDPEHPLLIGSVKTNLGHLEAAAGIAGFIKLALAIHHRVIPPSLHFERPNPDIPFEELRLRVQTSLGPWPGDGIALGGVSSFGWGGTNCHIVVEGLPERQEWILPVAAGERGKLAFVFSPHGSPWPGMGRDLLLEEPVFRAAIERCDRVMRPWTGWSMLEEMTSPRGSRWDLMEVAVPGVFAVQVALAALWRSWGIEPDAVVGHSIGEMAAAYVSGALSLEDAARVAVEYGRAVGKTSGKGAMGIVQLGPGEAAELVASEGDRLVVAGWSSPESTLLAGEPSALDLALAKVKVRGLFAARVQVDVAAHSPQMVPLLDDFRKALEMLRPRRARVPLISTVTGAPLGERKMDAEYWAENLREPVRFSAAMEHLAGEGYGVFLQLDPHPILATPLEQCLGGRGTVLASMRRQEPARPVLLGSLAALAAAGRPVLEGRPETVEVLPLSARSPEALREMAGKTAALLASPGDGALHDVAYTAAVRRGHHEHRLAAVGGSREETAERLSAFARGEAVAGLAVGRRVREAGGVVFAFSGQGPQWHGMGRQLFAEEPVYRAAVEECDELLRPHLGGSLLTRLEEDGALDRTEIAQPALFSLQVGLAALWRSWGVTPAAVVGHSVGEIAAAHAAGILLLEDAARVVALRGRAMEPARGRGKMAAVEIPVDEALAAVAGFDGLLEIAAVNGPASCTIAGDPEALEEAVSQLREQGATCRMLRVEYAFHTAQMEPYDADLEAALADLRPGAAEIPMASTVTGALVAGPELDGSYWRKNVRRAVLFADAVGTLEREGYGLFLEIGPHPVLAASIAQCADAQGREASVLASLRRGRDERETLLESLGSLYTLGLPIDWRGVHPDGGRLVRLPVYPFQRQRYWFEVEKEAALFSPAVPVPAAPEAGIEQILADQLDAFNRMVAQQLEVLRASND